MKLILIELIYVSEVYWREGKVNKTKALILSPLKKKMSEKKQVFVSIASPNNLTPTSEKPVLYYGGSPTMACKKYFKTLILYISIYYDS